MDNYLLTIDAKFLLLLANDFTFSMTTKSSWKLKLSHPLGPKSDVHVYVLAE